MVIRLISVADQLQLPAFHYIFRAILGWDGDLGYIIRLMRTWLNGQTSLGNAVLRDKVGASLILFARVADLLKEVLPVGNSVNQETVWAHLYGTGERIEQELGEER